MAFDPDAHLDSDSSFDPDAHLDIDITTAALRPDEGYFSKWFGGIKKSASKFGSEFAKKPIDSLLGMPRAAVETVVSPIAHTLADSAALLDTGIGQIPGASKLGFNTSFQDARKEYNETGPLAFGNAADPKTSIGQATAGLAGSVMQPVGDALSMPGKAAATIAKIAGASPGTQQTVEQGTNTITNAALLRSSMQEPKAPSKTILDEKSKALKEAQDLGYVTPPSTSNPTAVNNLAEGFAGKLSTAQGASIKNQPLTNNLARQELGLPEDMPLTHETMSLVRKSADPAYEAVKQEPSIPFGHKYEKELSNLTKTADKINSTLPNYKSTASVEIKNLIDSIKPENGVMDGETAVELSKSLRSESKAYDLTASRSGDPQARSLARAYRGAAEAVENAIEDHFIASGQPEIAANWDNARRLIAKSYSIENALDGAGNVDAGKLGKQLLKGKPLSPKLEAAANFALHFPKSAKVVNESMPGMSPLDVYGSVAASTISGNPAPLLLGPGRMAARSALLGPVGQWMARPSQASGVPSLMSEAVRPVTLSGLMGQRNND